MILESKEYPMYASPHFWINPRWSSGPASTIHHAAGHVFAVTRVTFHHHRSWFENGPGWWYTYPSENMSQFGITSHTIWIIKNVPNHQWGTWWSLPPTTVRDRPSPPKSPAHRRSTWSECEGRGPNWSGILVSRSPGHKENYVSAAKDSWPLLRE